MTSDLEDLSFGTNSISVTATADDNTSDFGIINTQGEYCDYDDNNNLNIEIKELDVRGGFGNDDEWYAFDLIEVEVDIENNGDEKIKDIEVEWGLYDRETGKFIVDDSEKDFDLKDGKEETITIEFKLDEDIEDLDGGDFIFIVKATGEDEEFDGDRTCASDSESVDVIIEDDFVLLDDIEFLETVSCGTDLQVTADVWNIGEDEQEDVVVIITERSLDINEKIIIGEIEEFDSEQLDAILQIPSDAKEGIYYIEFRVYDDDSIYETEENDKALFKVQLTIKGSCSDTPDQGSEEVFVDAILESGGQAGQELVVKVTVTNTGDELIGYELGAESYEDWATLTEISPRSLVLDAGDSKESLFTFEVNKNVEGEKVFNIKITSGGDLITIKPASVLIEKRGGGFGITGAAISEDNWYLWGIGLLNIILVIIIIIVAVRVARR